VGKTALVNKWLSQMGRDNYRGAERVYGWLFYSQGAAEGRQVSADQFIAAALTWFGDPDPTAGSPWDKGERLAELIKAQRTLLILDGLEPLQSPPPVETGKIKDPGLTSLLRELARQNPGLVVISTRLAVDDLKDFVIASDGRVGGDLPPYRDQAKQSPRGEEIASTEEHRLAMTGTMLEIDLDSLSDESGAAYLKYLGVDGTDKEREQASHDFGGHALALTLLGRYIKVVHNGDIRKRGEIPHVMDEQKQGAHARRVMESYERWLQGKPELDILRLMGLFDRPAEKGALDKLREEPVIQDLTNALQKLSDINWKYAVSNLRELRLLAPKDPYEPDTLDCHPLLREHFGEKLKTESQKAWREAHGRLYDYYKSAAKELPDTLEEMAQLFAAVLHGCLAERYDETFWDVYWDRISRDIEYFATRILGAGSAELSILSGFFRDTTWRTPVEDLIGEPRGFVLNQAGLDLRALGRLLEAVQPAQAGFELAIGDENWTNATRSAINIGETFLFAGDLTKALEWAKVSVELADRSRNPDHTRGARVFLGKILHYAGHFLEAGDLFRTAIKILKHHNPSESLLVRYEEFQYCDFLLDQGQIQDVYTRSNKWQMEATRRKDPLEIAFYNTLIGRTLFRIRMYSERVAPLQNPFTCFNRVIDNLRLAGYQDYIPLGLLARAEYYRVTDDLVKAQKDLDEAFTIATRGGMGLHLADCHLEFARLQVAKLKGLNVQTFQPDNLPTELVEARKHLVTAKEMINKMGYHRRDKEVEELEEQLKT
jgi:tetratricopeptide (TPR) repeat protein